MDDEEGKFGLTGAEVVDDVMDDQAVYADDSPGGIQILRADGTQGSFFRVVHLSELNGSQSSQLSSNLADGTDGTTTILVPAHGNVAGNHAAPVAGNVMAAQFVTMQQQQHSQLSPTRGGGGGLGLDSPPPLTTSQPTTIQRLYTVTTGDGGVHLATSPDAIQQTVSLNGGNGGYFVLATSPDSASTQIYTTTPDPISNTARRKGTRESPKLIRDEKRRSSHNEVERRRRDKINQWIFKLADMIPDFHVDTRQGQSKGVILSKCCEYINQLKTSNEELAGSLNAAEHLALELENERNYSKQLEEQLAENGLKPLPRPTLSSSPLPLPSQSSSSSSSSLLPLPSIQGMERRVVFPTSISTTSPATVLVLSSASLQSLSSSSQTPSSLSQLQQSQRKML